MLYLYRGVRIGKLALCLGPVLRTHADSLCWLTLADVHFSCYPGSQRQEGQVGMKVLGIDPGLRALGWGVIRVDGPRLTHVANGICRSGDGSLAARLLELFKALSTVVETHGPDAAAVENTFVNRDGAATLKLGQARGIAMLVPAAAGLDVGEYAPNAVKKTVVGVGHADKRQVLHMVKMQLPGANIAGPDAADALAIAICHAFHLQSAHASIRVAERAPPT